MWKWNTVCHAARPHELSRLTPSAPSRSWHPAREPLRGDDRGLEILGLDLEQVARVPARDDQRVPARGRVDVHERDRALVLGRRSAPGSRRATILQKMQSGSLTEREPTDRPSRAARGRSSIASSRGSISPAKLASSSSARIRPSSGPGASPSARASSSPRTGGRGGSATQRERLAEQLPGELEVPGDRLVGAVAARRQPVGDAQHRHVDLDGLAGAQVAVDRAPRRAASRGRGTRAAGGCGPAPRRARRSRSLARSRVRTARAVSRAGGVVADERDPALGGHAARLRLGDVVQQRAEAQRLPAGQLVGERLARGTARPRRRGRRAQRSGSRSSSIVSRQHRDACGRRRRGGGSGSARRRAAAASSGSTTAVIAELVHQLEPVDARARRVTIRLSSANTRSGATASSAGRACARRAARSRARPRSRARTRAARAAAPAAGRG